MGVAKLLLSSGYRVVTSVEGRRWGVCFFVFVLFARFSCLGCSFVWGCVAFEGLDGERGWKRGESSWS